MAHTFAIAASTFYNFKIYLAHGDPERHNDLGKEQVVMFQWGMGGGYKGTP